MDTGNHRPQLRDGIAMLPRSAYQFNTPAKISQDKTRRLLPNEEARFDHYKGRNRLPPLRVINVDTEN